MTTQMLWHNTLHSSSMTCATSALLRIAVPKIAFYGAEQL
jgi:hypothetical protein